jgi:hypothetical protein
MFDIIFAIALIVAFIGCGAIIASAILMFNSEEYF